MRDRLKGKTERVPTSVRTGGSPTAACSTTQPSASGRFVAFDSPATNLVAGDTNGAINIFVDVAMTERRSG